MAEVRADRVCETSTTTGTGALTLAGAVAGFRDFDSVMNTSDTCFYTIEAIDGSGVPTGAWETGYGTFNSTGPTLTRTLVHASSNSNAAVSFAAGTKRVFMEMTDAALTGITPAVPTMPTVRSSSISSSSAASYVVSWPSGTIAGDLVVIVIGGGFSPVRPTGWAQLDFNNGTNAQGGVFAKVMDSGDISAGSVTVTMSGTFNSVVMALTITGSTLGRYHGINSFQSGSNITTVSVNLSRLEDEDLVVTFAYFRGAGNVTLDDSTNIQAVNATNASGAIASYDPGVGQLGMTDVVNMSAGNSGYYIAILSFGGL